MKNDKKSQKKYLKFLRSLIKDKPYISLGYMTRILPIKKYGEQSSINNFKELSMTSPEWMAKYIGFVEIEVKELCEKQKKIKITNIDNAHIENDNTNYKKMMNKIDNLRKMNKTYSNKKNEQIKILKATWDCKEKNVAKLIEKYHNEVDNESYNNEKSLKYTILHSYYVADEYYNSYIEFDSAIDQNKKRKYPQKFKRYNKILLVGISYDNEAKNNNKNFKRHTCKIDKIYKN
ncbi:hypothetical protein PIROE2DRAFT_2752 [Piromyces sp. E2]|nr:hypothetical protein PIROE2DRAFT_2752 [Piromyces sp. E2]|eukprot:OUM69260.1 hypothetical protein PIROE2DRAFT_2752 [Piromyces sp. E2]